MKSTLNYLASPIRSVWNYFVSMNSEPQGGPSIKRNISWGIATLVAFVQIYSLVVLPHETEKQLEFYESLCKFYTVVDITFILLALSITSIEKLTMLVQHIKGNIAPKQQDTKPDNEKPTA